MYGQFNKTTRHLRTALAVVATVGTLVIPAVGWAMDIYGGLSLGQARHETTGGDLLGPGFTSAAVDGDSNGGKAFIAMELWDKYVGAEFGYADLGQATAKSGAASATSKARAYTASLVGLIPFGSQSGVMIRLGLAGAKAHLKTSGGTINSANSADIKILGGLGVQHYFSKTWGVRVEAERYNMGSIGSPYVNMISAGVVYQFEK
jgi:hypothetical protein